MSKYQPMHSFIVVLNACMQASYFSVQNQCKQLHNTGVHEYKSLLTHAQSLERNAMSVI